MKLCGPTFAMAVMVLLAGCGDDGEGPGSNALSSATATSTQITTPIPQATATPDEAAVPRSEAVRLQVCIDVSPAAAALVAPNEALSLALAGLPAYKQLYQLSSDMTKADGAEAYEPFVTPLLDFGCPDGYLPASGSSAFAVKPQPVTTPSPYHLHIFVATEAEIAGQVPAGEKFFRRGYEWQQYDLHTGAEVTTAMYVPLSQMRVPATVGWVFADGTTITPILRYPCGHPDPAPKCQGIRP